MVKIIKNLCLSAGAVASELSIFESRKQIRLAQHALSGGLHPRSTPQRIGQCRKADQRGLRKSSSLTNGTGPVRNKTALGEYAKGGPRSFLLPTSLSMRLSWALR
jgi:hypothetical protein